MSDRGMSFIRGMRKLPRSPWDAGNGMLCRSGGYAIEPSRPQTGHRLAGGEGAAPAAGAVLDGLQYSEQLADPAHQQALLLDLDPHAGRGGEHDVVAGPDRHGNPDVLPPVEAGTDGEHDAVLGGRLLGARRHDQPGAANPIGVQLLDHDAVEQGAE